MEIFSGRELLGQECFIATLLLADSEDSLDDGQGGGLAIAAKV